GDVIRRCSQADVLLDLSLVNPLRPWTDAIPFGIAVDTDPVFNQVRNLIDPDQRARSERHDVRFTFAEGVGSSAALPDDGFDWRPTRQPVVLDAWPVTPGPRSGRFTTVLQWDSYPTLEHDGRRFGMKSESFEPFFELPTHTCASLELALGSAVAPRAELEAAGWRLRNP